jgi:hypothetical protein
LGDIYKKKKASSKALFLSYEKINTTFEKTELSVR